MDLEEENEYTAPKRKRAKSRPPPEDKSGDCEQNATLRNAIVKRKAAEEHCDVLEPLASESEGKYEGSGSGKKLKHPEQQRVTTTSDKSSHDTQEKSPKPSRLASTVASRQDVDNAKRKVNSNLEVDNASESDDDHGKSDRSTKKAKAPLGQRSLRADFKKVTFTGASVLASLNLSSVTEDQVLQQIGFVFLSEVKSKTTKVYNQKKRRVLRLQIEIESGCTSGADFD